MLKFPGEPGILGKRTPCQPVLYLEVVGESNEDERWWNWFCWGFSTASFAHVNTWSKKDDVRKQCGNPMINLPFGNGFSAHLWRYWVYHMHSDICSSTCCRICVRMASASPLWCAQVRRRRYVRDVRKWTAKAGHSWLKVAKSLGLCTSGIDLGKCNKICCIRIHYICIIYTYIPEKYNLEWRFGKLTRWVYT